MFRQLFDSFFRWPFDTDKRCSLCRKESKLTSLCWLYESISMICCPELMGTPHDRGIHTYKYCQGCLNKHFDQHMRIEMKMTKDEFVKFKEYTSPT